MRWWYPRVHASLLVLLLVFLALALALSSPSTAQAAQQSSCDGPVAGKHVYDCAGILTADEVAEIETHAAAVNQAGAPTIIYLQVRDASLDETIQDAADLMNNWSVVSSPGAQDGFVMFLNLLPGNERHGQAALYAGDKHFRGNLPQQELQRISSEVMAPLLKEEQTAEGIIAGLDAVAHDLRYGPPPNGVASFIRLPANVLAALLAAAVCLLYLKMVRRKSQVQPVEPMTTPPGDLTPDLAGALVRGRVDNQLIQARILYMAHEEMLVVERHDNEVALRLLDHQKPLPGIQQPIWELLAKAADAEHLVFHAALEKQQYRWLNALKQVREELMNRQWYDRYAGVRRSWLGWSSAALLFLGCFDVIATLVVGEAWGFLGSAILLGFGVAALVWAVQVPRTTPLGESIAAEWRAYRTGLEDAANQPEVAVDLDIAIPYALAMGAERFLFHRMVLAGGRGKTPAWLLAPHQDHSPESGFAHYWSAFRLGLLPVQAQASSSGSYHSIYHSGDFGGGFSGGFDGGGGAGTSF
jgi:uncharacterized protein (TIGR04222 family)